MPKLRAAWRRDLAAEISDGQRSLVEALGLVMMLALDAFEKGQSQGAVLPALRFIGLLIAGAGGHYTCP